MIIVDTTKKNPKTNLSLGSPDSFLLALKPRLSRDVALVFRTKKYYKIENCFIFVSVSPSSSQSFLYQSDLLFLTASKNFLG